MFFQRISEMLSEAKENQKETQENDCVVAALPRCCVLIMLSDIKTSYDLSQRHNYLINQSYELTIRRLPRRMNHHTRIDRVQNAKRKTQKRTRLQYYRRVVRVELSLPYRTSRLLVG
jgi:hypothetical protein